MVVNLINIHRRSTEVYENVVESFEGEDETKKSLKSDIN